MTDLEMWEKIENVLSDEGMKYDSDDFRKEGWVCIEFWTDTAGQDIITEFEYDGTPNDFIEKYWERANNYDVDEEVDLYSGHRGENGVPSDYKTLIADMEEAKETLMSVANQLYQIKIQAERENKK